LVPLRGSALQHSTPRPCGERTAERLRRELRARLLTTHLAGKSLVNREVDEWHSEALNAILEHPTCEETFGTITDVFFMEEESAWYNERNVLAYWIEGKKASGHLVGRFVSNNDAEQLHDGHIQLESGKAIALKSETITA